MTAETGPQPWIVYGKLTTAAAVSPLKPAVVLASLIAFILVYLTLLGTYAYYVVRAVREGPEEGQTAEPGRLIPEPGRGTPVPSLSPAT